MNYGLFSEKSAIDIFGASAPYFGKIAEALINRGFGSEYSIQNMSSLNVQDTAEMNRIMWDEILQRTELCTLTSLLRSQRWAEGAIEAYRSKNLLAWAAAARGLIEAVADSYFVLRYAATTLAENHRTIQACLAGDVGWTLVVTKKLEDELIHFTHARIQTTGEQKQVGHTPRSARDYINTLNETGSPDNYEAYQILCNYTHPSAHSLIWMIDVQENSERSSEFSFSPFHNMEMGSILNVSLKYRRLFHSLLEAVANISVMTLKTSRNLRQTLSLTDGIDTSIIPLDRKLDEAIVNSKQKYERLNRGRKQVEPIE
ncbi:hypothetical protein G6L28_22225 [Agrobacterium larrymoorei]|uniref:hypothetical protein n=1 Tax=Agrobacterium larrymoorei TaxID=160699 RepID=UPI00157496FF|nr:hypothetical protein [Agrobacterium larrymoorei]NTJ45289.1 hypothetical protein [Agrobacterium larrymoorei]